jgi:hypothetical protein
MNNLSNNPKPGSNSDGTPNYPGAFFLLVLLIGGVKFLLWFSLGIGPKQILGFLGNIHVTNSGVKIPETVIGFFAMHLILSTAAFGLVALLTWILQKPILSLVDRRQLPKADKEFVPNEDLGKTEFYESEIGEEFEFAKPPDWFAEFILKVVPKILSAVLGGFILTTLFTFVSGGSLLQYPVNFLIYVTVYVFTALLYYKVEWHRQTQDILLFFTCNVIHLSVHDTGIIGFIIGKNSDVARDLTPYTMIREPQMASDPRRLNNPGFKGDAMNLLYAILGSIRGIRSLYLPSIFKNASNLAVRLSWGNAVLRIMEHLSVTSVELHKFLEDVEEQKNRMTIGRPEDKSWTIKNANRQAEKFERKRTRHLAPSQVYNLIAVRKIDPGRWDLKTGKPKVEFKFKSEEQTSNNVSSFFADTDDPGNNVASQTLLDESFLPANYEPHTKKSSSDGGFDDIDRIPLL